MQCWFSAHRQPIVHPYHLSQWQPRCHSPGLVGKLLMVTASWREKKTDRSEHHVQTEPVTSVDTSEELSLYTSMTVNQSLPLSYEGLTCFHSIHYDWLTICESSVCSFFFLSLRLLNFHVYQQRAALIRRLNKSKRISEPAELYNVLTTSAHTERPD